MDTDTYNSLLEHIRQYTERLEQMNPEDQVEWGIREMTARREAEIASVRELREMLGLDDEPTDAAPVRTRARRAPAAAEVDEDEEDTDNYLSRLGVNVGRSAARPEAFVPAPREDFDEDEDEDEDDGWRDEDEDEMEREADQFVPAPRREEAPRNMWVVDHGGGGWTT